LTITFPGGLVLSLALLSAPVWADASAEREFVISQILAREGALFVEYSVGDSGRVILLFGANEPDWRIERAVKALQSNPDIPGLTWTKMDTDFCPIR
jgi:hypothetical protein